MSTVWQEDIDLMMQAFGQEVRLSPDSPSVSADEFKLRVSLIVEEMQELVAAIEDGDLVGMADGIVDSLVVVIGTASCLGIEIGPLWDIIQENNMSKITGPIRADGKRLKPEGWKPPDVEGELKRQGWTSDKTTS